MYSARVLNSQGRCASLCPTEQEHELIAAYVSSLHYRTLRRIGLHTDGVFRRQCIDLRMMISSLMVC